MPTAAEHLGGGEEAAVRLLIVDDHMMVREGLRAVLLAEPGIEVIGEGGTGTEAVRLARDLRPEVVVMDIFMPGMDGFEATSAIADAKCDTGVLLITGNPRDEQGLLAMRLGAAGYLLKTAPASELRQAIRTVAGGGTYVDARVAGYLEQVARADASDSGPESLTRREWEVFRLVAHGHTSRESGERLFISPRTVDTHRERIMLKLGLKTRAELVQFALERGLMQPGS